MIDTVRPYHMILEESVTKRLTPVGRKILSRAYGVDPDGELDEKRFIASVVRVAEERECQQ